MNSLSGNLYEQLAKVNINGLTVQIYMLWDGGKGERRDGSPYFSVTPFPRFSIAHLRHKVEKGSLFQLLNHPIYRLQGLLVFFKWWKPLQIRFYDVASEWNKPKKFKIGHVRNKKFFVLF